MILSGSYVEAGDRGRLSTGPGDVLLHRPYEAHLDRFDAAGAEVLILPLDDAFAHQYPQGRIDNVDEIARLAERDTKAASREVATRLEPVEAIEKDWPDLLARWLRENAEASIADWCDDVGLRPETISRGFGLAYGTTPRSYRATARARRALVAIGEGRQPLAEIALQCGFADQAHMSRAVRDLTGQSPRRWRVDRRADETLGV